ncbi:MAG: molybdenum ABC transporter ATP-binding protein [Pseudomonadales bacterium]
MEISIKAHLTRSSGFVIDVDIIIPPVGITALYGPSGSGKSTLLKLIAGLERGSDNDHIEITSGSTVWQNDKIFVPAEKRSIGYVFQQHQLFPHLSVQGNLDFAIKRQHVQSTIDFDQVAQWLDIQPLLNKKITQLSGGEAQRVAMARVLLSGARCILMDEPLGAIDSAARARILPYLDRLHRNLEIPMIYVSHSFDEITYLADQLFVLNNGKVSRSGSLFELSSDLELASGQGDASATVIQCRVHDHDKKYDLSELNFEDTSIFVNAQSHSIGDLVRVRIPARDVSIATSRPENSSILNIIKVEIVSFEEAHDRSVLVRLRRNKQFLLARITRKSMSTLSLHSGQQVYAQIKSVALLNKSNVSTQ